MSKYRWGGRVTGGVVGGGAGWATGQTLLYALGHTCCEVVAATTPIGGAVVGACAGIAVGDRIGYTMEQANELQDNVAILMRERQEREQRMAQAQNAYPVLLTEADIEDFCTCPITLDVIDDPVFLPEDRTLVERSAFEALYQNPHVIPISPMTRARLGEMESYGVPQPYITMLDGVRTKKGLAPSAPTRTR